MTDEQKDTQQSGGNTDIKLSIPSTGNELTFSGNEWESFITNLHEYAGEQFLSGSEGDKAVFERLLRASGVTMEGATAS